MLLVLLPNHLLPPQVVGDGAAQAHPVDADSDDSSWMTVDLEARKAGLRARLAALQNVRVCSDYMHT